MRASAREGSIKLRPLLEPDLRISIKLLVERWAKREPSAVSYVETLLEQAGLDQEAIAAETLLLKLVIIERIERMITERENRRNTMLREIDRHRDGVAQRLRDMATQIEDAEFRGSQGRTPPNEAFGARAGQSRKRATQHGAKTPAGKSAASRNALRHGTRRYRHGGPEPHR